MKIIFLETQKMLVKILLLTTILCLAVEVYGQGVSVSESDSPPDPSAMLDVQSTEKGFLPPRMSTAQMNAIASPAEGLTIYNTSIKSLCYYDGTSWVASKEGKSCGDINYGGKTYSTVIIGAQCWMAQNLNIGTRINGVYNQSIFGGIEKYCYDDLESNCNTYGGLYQWNEMMNYDTLTPGTQGICPTGWHLPTVSEWSVLLDYLGGSGLAGGKMKTTGTTHWQSPNTGATNSSGFSGLPGGIRDGVISIGDFTAISWVGDFWSSTEYSSGEAWYVGLNSNVSYALSSISSKVNGFSVRCIRN